MSFSLCSATITPRMLCFEALMFYPCISLSLSLLHLPLMVLIFNIVPAGAEKRRIDLVENPKMQMLFLQLVEGDLG